MTKSPHLIRANRYFELFNILNAKMRATQSALEVYLAKPTAENNKALGIARDDMESTKDWTLKEVEELKKQSHQAEQIPILA